MNSRISRKISRALRHTKKSIGIGASLAKSAQAAGELAVASGVVINRRGQMLGAAVGAPLAGANPEFVRMGAEKAIAMSSIGTGMFPNILALQRTWMNLGLVQVRLATVMTGALLQSSSPAVAAKVIARAAEKALADGVDAVLDVAQSGQAIVDGALKPLHRAASLNAKRLSRARRSPHSARS